MPAPSPTYWTVDDVQALPSDGNKYELVYGKLLVSPSPRFRHQRIVMRLAILLVEYCTRAGLGEVFCVAADLTWGRRDVLTQPDIFVIGTEDAHVRRWEEVRRVPLIAEALTPSTESYDRFDKRFAYRDMGVALYWILDCDAKHVEVWTPEAQFPVVEAERLEWHPEGASEPLVVDLPTLFAD